VLSEVFELSDREVTCCPIYSGDLSALEPRARDEWIRWGVRLEQTVGLIAPHDG
jgi:hypothetical protein